MWSTVTSLFLSAYVVQHIPTEAVKMVIEECKGASVCACMCVVCVVCMCACVRMCVRVCACVCVRVRMSVCVSWERLGVVFSVYRVLMGQPTN